MKKVFFAIIFLVFIACKPVIVQQFNRTTQNLDTCNPPNYEYTLGDCCRDSDSNKVCDRDEQQVIPKQQTISEQPVVGTTLTDAIAKFKQNVSSYSFYDGKIKYFVKDRMIRIKLDKMQELPFATNNSRTYVTDIFVDRERQTATGYCDPRSEMVIMGDSFGDRSVCKKLINIPITLSYAEYNPVLPEDWLFKFSNAIPVRVEEIDQFVKEPTGWKTVNPAVYVNEGNAEVVLRLETKTGLPIKVEKISKTNKEITSYTWLVPNPVKPEEVVYQKFAR